MTLKIAVLSDLHCRDSKESTITTYLYSDLLKVPITRHPVESLKKLIIDNNISCTYLICLGDITDKINQQGLISGWSYIKEIAEVLNINSKNIIVVAGNHDIDSRKTHGHPEFNHIINSLNSVIPLNDKDSCTKFWNDKYIIKEYEDLIILAYNSVYNHTDEARAKETDISDVTLENLHNDLKKIQTIQKPKIALSHHHPIKFSNFDLIYKDGDSIENGDKFMDLLTEFHFSLFVHGHKHIPRLENRNDLPIFCSGSFSSLENLKVLSRRNSFHIVELIDNYCLKSKGLIETYEFVLGRGWKKNTDSDGFFPANTGFGFSGDLNILSNQINKWFIEQNKELIRFNELKDKFSEILFLTPFQQKELESFLLKNGNIKIIPSLKVTPEFITKLIEK